MMNDSLYYDDFLISQNLKFENSLDSLLKKRTGSYYTNFELTDFMMGELISQIITDNKRIEDLSFLEPCVGCGNYVFSYLKQIRELNLSSMQIKKVLSNIYVADINKEALHLYKSSLKKFVELNFSINLDDSYFDSHIAQGLLIDVTKQNIQYISLSEAFPNLKVEKRFDIIVTNPPYKNLKAEKNNYKNEDEYTEDKIKYSEIENLVKHKFQYSTEGTLNFYKLFVEEIFVNYAHSDSYISLLIPSSILSDKTCTKLRTYILNNTNLLDIKIIKEGNRYINAQQSLIALLSRKGKSLQNITLTKDFINNKNQKTLISIKDILNHDTGNAIFSINEYEYSLLKKLKIFPTIKQLSFIDNLRGELDLTANVDSITTEPTDYELLRGKNISYYSIDNSFAKEFSKKTFVEFTKKKFYIENDRIICQQVANMNKNRRVTFAYIQKNYVLANSCNFLYVHKNNFNLDLYSLLGIMNSSIINWYFKLTSSNNHVNNYEIDSFPIPIKSQKLSMLSKLVQDYLMTKNENLLEEIESLVLEAYGIENQMQNVQVKITDNFDLKYFNSIKYIIPSLNQNDALEILHENRSLEDYLVQNNISLSGFDKKVFLGITDKFKKLLKDELLNHTTFKLSDLDLEMIRNIPQGGNWKNIPQKTVEKSKRLKRISETGGRTTLYGRIDYNKPSYTITTYFNRPGNGTYVHPIHNRVISVREAARFQTFRDSYYFFGNKTEILNQVGNAVPTLLAYQIGKQIISYTNCNTSIDLFCGAGGMTTGFKEAGINSVLCNDIVESACISLKINNPEIPILCGDVTKVSIKEEIIRRAVEKRADIICGGPPCQGFSLAGFRDDKDPRNLLFKEFVEIVEKVSPKVIVFENVEGLLSYQNGKTYNEILTLFYNLGYLTEGRLLKTNEFGIPQKRKRVIIICTRNNLNIKPSSLFPTTITPYEENQISALQTIGDLENIQCSEDSVYNSGFTISNEIIDFFRERISYNQYVTLIKEKSHCKELEFSPRQLVLAL